MAIKIVDLPIQHGDFPVRYVSLPTPINYQVYSQWYVFPLYTTLI